MIIFPHLRTKRIAVQLREITLGEARAICRMPADRYEATTTELLRFIARDASAPSPGYVTNPRLWTVEERARLLCHYLSQVSESGADFSVGKDGKLSDYLLFDKDISVSEVRLGEVAGTARVLRPLLGVHAEVLERLCSSRGEWLLGLLACQIHDAAATVPAYTEMTDVELLEWCKARIEAINALPESDFESLYLAWTKGCAQIEHFYSMSLDDDGVVFLPQGDREAGPNYPARFRALSCIAEGTRALFAGPDQPGR